MEWAAFAATRGRLPSPRAKDKDEARLGKWPEMQQEADRTGELFQLRRPALSERLGAGLRRDS